MKGLKDYVVDKGCSVDVELGYYSETEGYKWITIHAKVDPEGKLKVFDDSGEVVAQTEDELTDWFESKYCGEVRFCDHCGKPMQEGFTDDAGSFYNCEDCFPVDMNERYGEGNWRPTDGGEENEDEGYYEYRESPDSPWEPEPSYYTEWI